eukprot:3451741-Amphidinium_carterae.4
MRCPILSNGMLKLAFVLVKNVFERGLKICHPLVRSLRSHTVGRGSHHLLPVRVSDVNAWVDVTQKLTMTRFKDRLNTPPSLFLIA